MEKKKESRLLIKTTRRSITALYRWALGIAAEVCVPVRLLQFASYSQGLTTCKVTVTLREQLGRLGQLAISGPEMLDLTFNPRFCWYTTTQCVRSTEKLQHNSDWIFQFFIFNVKLYRRDISYMDTFEVDIYQLICSFVHTHLPQSIYGTTVELRQDPDAVRCGEVNLLTIETN